MMDKLNNVLETVKKLYDDKTYSHVLRVAAYVSGNSMIPSGRLGNSIIVAVMHGLASYPGYKDLGCGECNLYICKCLEILTRDKDSTYEDYIKNIKDNCNLYPEAYWVKIADIKDHLIQKEVLEDGAREKYIAALLQLL